MHTIGLLIADATDRRLVGDYLRGSRHVVQAVAPSDVDLRDWTGVSLVIADVASARQHMAELAALKRQTPDQFLPLLIALPPKESGAVWLQAGFDDALRLPLSKSELSARVNAFLRLRDQSAEQSSAYAAVAASEARFRSIFEHTAAGMAIADRSARLVQVNASLCRFLGYTASELTNGTVAAVTHPDDRAETGRLFHEALSGQRSAFDIEKRYVRKDGLIVWGRTAAVFQLDANQQPLYCIAIIQDITARKLAEAERDLLNVDLRASRERMRLLTRQVVSAQEDERKRLSRDLHDELGQTLAVLKISLALIERDMPVTEEGLSKRMQEAIGLTDMTIDQMRQIARDLRPLSLDELGLYATLETLCRNFAERTLLAVHCNFGSAEPRLKSEAQIGLYRFVQEALTNVAKHSQAHTVRVSVDTDRDEVRLSVTDDGDGFDMVSKVLMPNVSTGIGLMGMQERIDLLGGQLEITSQPGRGTRLVARLPLAEAT